MLLLKLNYITNASSISISSRILNNNNIKLRYLYFKYSTINNPTINKADINNATSTSSIDINNNGNNLENNKNIESNIKSSTIDSNNIKSTTLESTMQLNKLITSTNRSLSLLLRSSKIIKILNNIANNATKVERSSDDYYNFTNKILNDKLGNKLELLALNNEDFINRMKLKYSNFLSILYDNKDKDSYSNKDNKKYKKDSNVKLTDLSKVLNLSIPKIRNMFSLREPSEWYPLARDMKRKFIIHCGPTNSGKTHNALKRLTESISGIYCGPLRMLASEISARLNKQSVPCNLLTGQEVIDVEGALHTSCTIEMCNISTHVEVAVIDEMQMIADFERGYFWTRAVLGLCADEIHVCGDESMVIMISDLAKINGDDCEVVRYNRLAPLKMENDVMHSLKNVEKGDCVIAFSRLQLFELKKLIEKTSTHKCCIVYGSLPSETRLQQAELFNKREDYTVLVASNAIGMGLNLNIQRVIFATTYKPNGLMKEEKVPIGEIKQIGGRAGRFGFSDKPGSVTVLKNKNSYNYVKDCLEHSLHPIEKASIFPNGEQLEDLMFTFNASTIMEMCNNNQSQSTSTISGDGEYFFTFNPTYNDNATKCNLPPTYELEEDFISLSEDTFTPPPMHPNIPMPSNYSYEELRGRHYFSNKRIKDNRSILKVTLVDVMQLYYKHASVDQVYFMTSPDKTIETLQLLSDMELTIKERYMAAVAPTRRNNFVEFKRYMFEYSSEDHDCVKLGKKYKPFFAKTVNDLGKLEDMYRVFDLYIWLAYRFSSRKPFADVEYVNNIKKETSDLMAQSLEYISTQNSSKFADIDDEFKNNHQSIIKGQELLKL